jgi:hypothetical protein
MKLYHVRFADQPYAKRAERYAIVYPDITPGFPAFVMHPLVHDSPLSSKTVLYPSLFNVYQGASPRAI